MGKVSLNISQPSPVTPSTPIKTPQPTPIQVKSNLLPELTRKEWISVLTAVFIVLSVGFSLGYVVNIKRVNYLSNIVSIVDPLITIEKDLNDKLNLTMTQTENDKVNYKSYKIDDVEIISEMGHKLSNQDKNIIKRIRNKVST
jgi:hypothetical protein